MEVIQEKKTDNFKVCSRCIMDTSDEWIQFDEKGVCNHCYRHDELLESRVFSGPEAEEKIQGLVKKIKKAGKSKDYDCIIGVSGGVDSTYVAYMVKQYGLRPLAIHFDNGWNSELAVHNIEKVLKKLDIDLYTYVVDWEEFKDLQLAFLKASTSDSEIPTDHAINALLWKEASKRNIKYIISGMNFRTEAISVPNWNYGHSDWRYVKDIHRKFGKKKLKTYPRFSFFDLFYINLIKGVRILSFLNYVDYNKKDALKVLVDELGYEPYEGKHHESIYTRFFQSYILPRKFNIDKRKSHLSDLINDGQITREEAFKELEKDICNPNMLREDKDFVIKKLGLTPEEFEEIMNLPIKQFLDYKNSYGFVNFLKRVVNYFRKLNLYPR